MSIQVEREDAKGAKVCKKLDDAGLCKQLVEHLTAIGNLCKKLKAEKAVGAQKFQWKMIRQPVVWRVVLPEKVVEFEANFELWGDGKPESVGKLLRAPLDDEDDILFVPDAGEKDCIAVAAIIQKVFDTGA